MYCKKCNRQIPNESVYCMYCGAKVPVSEKVSGDWKNLWISAYEKNPKIFNMAVQLIDGWMDASASGIARHTGMDYSEAEKILEQLEWLGVVGPSPCPQIDYVERPILMSEEKFMHMAQIVDNELEKRAEAEKEYSRIRKEHSARKKNGWNRRTVKR